MIAPEQKARVTYDNILRLSDDPDVSDVIRFLRAREIVHFQRFGEANHLCKDRMDARNVYLTNPAFDKVQPRGNARGPEIEQAGRGSDITVRSPPDNFYFLSFLPLK